jgi:DNA (cytosine-5)-methyltransferase 1
MKIKENFTKVKQIGTKLDSNGGTQPYQQDRVYDSKGYAPALNAGKSDLIIKAGTWRTHKDGQGFRAIQDGNAPTIPARAREDGSGQPVIKMNYASKALNETIENSNLIEGEPQALDLYNRVARDESPTLTEPHHNSLRMFDGYRIRRLTPIECERLQGFPDDHTSFGNYDGEVKPVSNTQRYKQCGNAVTVDVVLAVAKKCIPLFK